MWTKEECRTFFSRILGLDLTDAELESTHTFLSANTATAMPRHGSPNAGLSPNILQLFIGVAVQRTGLQLDHARFKKVREEILPAAHFAILLRKLGYGDFLLVSSDMPNPDISLVRLDPATVGPSSTGLNALPLEMMYAHPHALANAHGASNAEKIANAIFDIKFSMRYLPQTILIVTLHSSISDADVETIARMLPSGAENPFHQVWLCFARDNHVSTLAMIAPQHENHDLTVEDLRQYSY